MFIFGLLTISSIRQHTTRTGSLTGSMRRRRTEGQLARMLILQVSVHLILVLPYGIMYCINSFHPLTQTPNAMAVQLAFLIWQQCDYFVSFFLYIFSGSVYRRELVRILTCNKTRNTSSTEKRKDMDREMSLISITTIQPGNGTMNSVSV
jgi:hypothetical protein